MLRPVVGQQHPHRLARIGPAAKAERPVEEDRAAFGQADPLDRVGFANQALGVGEFPVHHFPAHVSCSPLIPSPPPSGRQGSPR